MLAAFPIRGQWRFDTRSRRLALALLVSLLVHLALYGTWRIAPAVRKFVQQIAPDFLKVMLADRIIVLPPPTWKNGKMTFVEVDPATAVPDAPKDTKLYSTHNTESSNPKPAKAPETRLEGLETRMLRLTDNLKPKAQPLQPTAPKADPGESSEPEKPPPSPPPKIGDLAMTKVPPKEQAQPNPSTNDPALEQPKRPRPRTLQEAAKWNPNLSGHQSFQPGGVQRRGRVAMDAKASPFGDYDYAFVRAVEQRWNQLLDNNQYLLDRRGKVVITFRLHYDGRVSEVEEESNTVGDILGLLCQKAIMDPAPFPKWPAPMRQAVQGDYRDVKFTFFYD